MQENYRSKLYSNFIALGIIQGANFLLPLLVMPFVIQQIGIGRFGVVSVAHVFMIYLATIGDYGFNLTATRDVVLKKNDKAALSKIFYTVLLSKGLITACLFLLLLLLVFIVPFFQIHKTLYLLGFIYVAGQATMVGWFFQGVEKMHFITVVTLLSRLVFVILVFSFIKSPGDDILFLLFLGIGNVLSGIFSIYLALKNFQIRYVKPGWDDIIHELREGWQLTVSNLSINTYLYINVFILRLFTNDTITGYYSVAEKIFFAIRQVLGIFSQVIYPQVCQLVYQGKQQIVRFFRQVYVPFVLLVFVFCALVYVFAPFIVQLFVGRPSEISVTLLRMLSFVPVIVCLNIPAYQILLALNQKRSYLRILATGTVINIIANIFLVMNWGATGTIISIIITELFITIGLNWEVYKKNILNLIRPRTI